MANDQESGQPAAPRMTREESRKAFEQAWYSGGHMGDLSGVIPESWRGTRKLGGRLIRHVEDIPPEEWKAMAEGTWKPWPLVWEDDDDNGEDARPEPPQETSVTAPSKPAP
jgi:hypothetical protein